MKQRSAFLLPLLVLLGATPARAADDTACSDAIQQTRRGAALPARLLETLALVESGRVVAGRAVPWPWTINVDGTGHLYNSKAEAIAAVLAFQTGGAQSIDVGCMQINLRMHPNAFASLDDAFEPGANTRYGARFLLGLYAASRSWATAMTAYHSGTPARAADYARRILAIWPEASALGLAEIAVPPAAGTPDEVEHDYTEAFARQIAADTVARRARDAPVVQKPAASAVPRSLLRVASAEERHGSAWPGRLP